MNPTVPPGACLTATRAPCSKLPTWTNCSHSADAYLISYCTLTCPRRRRSTVSADDAVTLDQVIMATKFENLDIVPADIRLAGADVKLREMIMREKILAGKLAPAEECYDFVLLDCLPRNYHACFIGLEDKFEDGAIVVADNAGYGARGMANYLKHVRAKYKSTTEWFDIDLPWAKRDALEVTVVRRSEGTQK